MIKRDNVYISQWIRKAEEDKLAIQRLTEPDIIAPSVVCFHCQQMAEKYLKAFLIRNFSLLRHSYSQKIV